MVVRKKKKFRKFRGKRSYGYGSHKKHRGAGSRGGRGESGMHKHKWSYTIKYDPEHFGKHGFKRPAAVVRKLRTVNVSQLDALAAGKKKLDLAKLGYDKVLGDGMIETALEITAGSFSKKAVEKIETAGGKAVKIAGSGEKEKSETKKEEKERTKGRTVED